MRAWWIVAPGLLSGCIVGEHPDFMGDATANETGSTSGVTSEATGETTGGETTGTTGTTDPDTTTTEDTGTDTTSADTSDTGGADFHRIFVTSALYNGAIGGVIGADAECQALADAENLGGTWKALVSAGETSVRDRVTIDGPVLNMMDEQIAANESDLWDMMLEHPVLYDEKKTARPGDVWTGTAIDATASGVDCLGWTALTGGGHRGGAEDVQDDWLNRGFRFCNWTLSLYCISQ